MNKKLIAGPLVVILLLLATASTPALADGGFFLESWSYDLAESAQRAVILYGNCTANCTEHLILSVSFEGDAEDFAWVIPVPNIPEIAVTNADLFYELADFTETGPPVWFGDPSCLPPACQQWAGVGGGVDVIEEQVVGPYATAILSATNATALADWLNANGYIFPAQGEEIADEYIEKEWYYVATKINAVENSTGGALAEGSIEPIVLSFASNETVYPLRISSLSAAKATTPQVLLYVLADHAMVPKQYPLNIGYGNWTENAFTLESVSSFSVQDLPEWYDMLRELVSTYLPGDEFYLTKLRGWITADQMVDIQMVSYEEGDSLRSFDETGRKGSGIISLTMIIGPVLGLYIWKRHRGAISQVARQWLYFGSRRQ